MRVESSPNNSAIFYRSESVSPGIFVAGRECVRQPTVWRDSAFAFFHPAFPRRYGGCGGYILLAQRLHGLWDCHNPCPGKDAADYSLWVRGVRPQSPRWFPSAFLRRVHSRGRFSRRGGLRPPRREGFSWFPVVLCPWDSARHRPPKRALPRHPSAACQSQPTPPSSSHSASNAAHNSLNTPSSPHRWNQRCAVLSSPKSLGSWFHWQPARMRKIIPSSVLRQSAVGRPPAGFFGYLFLRIVSIRFHADSGIFHIVPIGTCFIFFLRANRISPFIRFPYIFHRSRNLLSGFEIISK